jgi:hypothetical protein
MGPDARKRSPRTTSIKSQPIRDETPTSPASSARWPLSLPRVARTCGRSPERVVGESLEESSGALSRMTAVPHMSDAPPPLRRLPNVIEFHPLLSFRCLVP